MSAETHIPREFKKARIATPEQAAEYVLDAVGPVAITRMRDSIAWAEREGRTNDAKFYRAVLQVLLTWNPPAGG